MFADVPLALRFACRRPPWFAVLLAIAAAALTEHRPLHADPVVPGTGEKLEQVGDDLEGEDWKYFPNHPKSSRNIDKRERGPLGQSQNGRWMEGPHRGTPDLLKRVPTPPGGLPGSQYALLVRTLHPGIPGSLTRQPQQDDLMVKVRRRMGGPVPVSWQPNCTVRVYVPPFDEWEDRTGSHFGFRADVWGSKGGSRELEQYWPGLFVNLQSKTHRQAAEDVAYLSIRGDQRGRDLRGPEVTPGWWTLGLSVSADGMCHFYARQGVDELRAEDRLASHYCYGFQAKRFDLFFFNVVTSDDGRTWSTPWIIDDPSFYCTRPVASRGRATSRR